MIPVAKSVSCFYCDSPNHFYPVDSNGVEYYGIQCYRCNRINLLRGWEVIYTSEEDARHNSNKCFGMPKPEMVQIPKLNNTIDQSLIVQKRQVNDIPRNLWTKTNDLRWNGNILMQRYIYDDMEKWEEIERW